MDFSVLEVQNRIKNKRDNILLRENINKKTNKSKYISNLFTRTLISIILVLTCAIFINIKDENLLFFKNKLFNNTLEFTKINNLYTKYFGNIVPEKFNITTPVFNDSNAIYTELEPFENSYSAKVNSNAISYLQSGIVVFVGEKENLGKTVIVQGVDGVDIWYSNLTNTNVTLYDYVEKNNILGEVNDNKTYLTFMENGEYIGYEKYIS